MKGVRVLFSLMNIYYYICSLLIIIIRILSIIIPLLIGIAYLTLLERKVIASVQRRKGPNVVGFFGLLQPLMDGLKLFLKETIVPKQSIKFLFMLAPVLTFMFSLAGWAVIPFLENYRILYLNSPIFFILAIASLGVYGVVLAGWASNSKYALLGTLRSTAQMISYEVFVGLLLINILLCNNTFDLVNIVLNQRHIWYIFPLLISTVLFFIAGLAETNRAPFDLPEAEAELVAGYNVEYSGMGFALFFLGEYSNMIFISAFTSILFLGGWLPFSGFFGVLCIGLKTTSLLFLFILIRAAFPRFRYDQLMRIGWKVFLPLSLLTIIYTSSLIILLDIPF